MSGHGLMSGQNEVAVLFLSQVMSAEAFELVSAMADRLGPVAVVTATEPPSGLPDAVQVHSAPPYDNRTYVTRAVSWSRYVASLVPRLACTRSAPVVFVTTNPPLLPLVAYLLRRRYGWPYVAWVWDLYPDAFVHQGLATARNPLVRLWARANRLTFGSAHAVLTLSPDMATAVARYMPRGMVPQVVPTWVDVDAIRPMPKHENPFVAEHRLADSLIVLYSGNLGVTHDLSGLFEAARSMSSDPRVRFLFVGGGARERELRELSVALPNVTWVPRQSASAVRYSMAAGDVAMVSVADGIGQVSMPSKTYSYMAAGCALLGLTSGENSLARVIERTSSGVNVDPRDTRAVIAALTRFRDDREFLDRCRRNARRSAETEWAATPYLDALVELVASARTRAGRG